MRNRVFTLLISIISLFVFCGCSNQPKENEVVSHNTKEIANGDNKNKYVEKKVTDNLNIYYPHYQTIDLVCGTMPSQNDKSILMMCEAAFTGAPLTKGFNHMKIAGNHVSGGNFYNGYSCKANTGAFIYYMGKWQFLLNNYADEIKKAADNGGMAFGQVMIVHNGRTQPLWRKNNNYYRALCELDGKLCIIDSKNRIPYKEFVYLLEEIKVKHAIYLDMGTGWNFSWYRDENGKVNLIHKKMTPYATNWIIFK